MEGKTYRYDLYMITALSNMHVGSGDGNFGVVDNLVQKDLITFVPIINSSGLKGALREFFNAGGIDDTEIDYIFGPPQKAGKDGKKRSGSGMYKFFTANLLTLPARSSKKPFFRATAPMLLKEFLNCVELFRLNITWKKIIKELIDNAAPEKGKPVIFEDLADVIIEDFKAVYKPFDKIDDLKSFMGCDIAIFHDDDFKELCENLPVIARNHLENGKSQNLWYEEVVPRQSRFYFILAVPDSEDTKNINQKFSDRLQKNLIQIGANASIGYGFTEIKRINPQEGQ